MLSLWLCIYVLSVTSDAFSKEAKLYVVNLDLPPEQRWNEIVQDYLPYLPQMNEEIG